MSRNARGRPRTSARGGDDDRRDDPGTAPNQSGVILEDTQNPRRGKQEMTNHGPQGRGVGEVVNCFSNATFSSALRSSGTAASRSAGV